MGDIHTTVRVIGDIQTTVRFLGDKSQSESWETHSLSLSARQPMEDTRTGLSWFLVPWSAVGGFSCEITWAHVISQTPRTSRSPVINKCTKCSCMRCTHDWYDFDWYYVFFNLYWFNYGALHTLLINTKIYWYENNWYEDILIRRLSSTTYFWYDD